MKTLKNLLLSLFVIASVGSMAQNEIKMQTATINIGEGKTYYFYDSGGESEFTVEEDPENNYRWKTWYNHNESFVLTLAVPQGSTKGIKVTFRSLLINNDNIRIFDCAPSDTSASTLIADLTNNDYSTDYSTFTVMSHGTMTITFKSDYHWRDAGWWAQIELDDYAPQAPVAMKGACDNYIHLLTTSTGTDAKIYYTTDGSTPTTASTLYTGAFAITGTKTVKAIAVVDNKTSAVYEETFTEVTIKPTVPEVTRLENTNTVTLKANKTPNLNDTWYVRYAYNDTVPTGSTGIYEAEKETTFELTKPCTLRVVNRGTTCPTHYSDEVTKIYNTIFVPAPTIEISESGVATIKCSMADATIYYTTDGSTPSKTNKAGEGSSQITTSALALGTTVKAIAIYEATGYDPSAVVSDIYIGSGSQVSGGIVLLDDREDHSWSYYSDGEQPVHSLKPADVKITYFGNGTGTVTSASENQVDPTSFSENATTVAVSGYEPANQFIYLKTLENANPEGSSGDNQSYPYTLIPNPFSKRPTVGTISTNNNSTCWRGFYGWRVKRLFGVTINGYEEGSIIPAETEIEFVTSNAEGNEVEFEAMWAQAYLADAANGNSLNANVSYERNFVRISGNPGTNTRPATIMELYPNGTTNGTTAATAAPNTARTLSARELSADTKFEFIALSGTNMVTANNHYLCFGRGINNSRNAARIQGINGNATDLNYTIRVESGQYDQFAFVRSSSATVSGRYYVNAIMGCDYDRANNDNSNLSVSAGNTLFFSTSVTFNNNSNRTAKTFDLVVKSGEYQKNYWYNQASAPTSANNAEGGGWRSSFYCGQNQGTNNYQGIRYVIVEGGEMGCMNGGRGTNGNSATYDPENNAPVVTLRIKGGLFHGAVYGGAADSETRGKRAIIITGGEIQSWVAGANNGTGTQSGSSAAVVADAYVYVGGDAIIGGDNANAVNVTNGGQVFGSGRGRDDQLASVVNSYVVIADDATISNNNNTTTYPVGGNVYGGGNHGYVTTTSNVYILGGTIQRNVFGGAFGNSAITGNTKEIPSTKIIMKGGKVGGNVYGGSNSEGNVGNVTMEITGGTIDTNVHGGGFGDGTNVTGNVVLTLGKDTQTTDGVIVNGDVYGGGALGKVNTANTANTTHVIVNKATIKGNVYGGGLGKQGTGNAAIKADVGTVTVDINGGKLNKVFGCNNTNGAPQGSVTVNFNGGEAIDVYGGGNLADYIVSGKFPTVNITGGSITNCVYGGGSLAKVNKTIVNMSGGEANNVYAGAEGKNVDSTLVTGNKTLNMTGGTAITVYGGSYTCLDKAYSFVNISGGRVKTHIFGSGYFGNSDGDCFIYIGKNAIEKAPYTSNNTDKLTAITVKPIWIEANVYAGANWGEFNGTFGPTSIIGRSNVYIDGTGYNMAQGKTGDYMVISGSVYGSGTSSEAGATDHSIIVRNYGNMTYPSMTRSLKSIQRAKELVLDNSNIDFVGQGDISSMDPTVEFGMCNIETIRAANANNISLSKPMDMVKKLGSYTCSDVYASSPTYTKTTYTTPSNGVVINNGGYLMVRYENNNNENVYGELEGYFYMREPGDDAGINNEGYIFARPKLIPGHGTSYVDSVNTKNIFINDGGFVDFDESGNKNVFDANGDLVPEQQGNRKAAGAVQMAYTNRTDADHVSDDRSTEAHNKTDYRYWRYEPETFPTVTREIVFVVKADDEASSTSTKFLTTTGSVQFPPALSSTNKYYITSLTWGANGKDCNPAPIAKTDNAENGSWIYYDEGFQTKTAVTETDLQEYYANPNATFGFLMQFDGQFSSQNAKILDNESYASYYKDKKNALAEVNGNNGTDMPELNFLLTYSDRLSQNELWSEAKVTIDEIDTLTGDIKQRIYLNISVTTSTKFGSNVETEVYASASGTGVDVYKASLALPTFTMANNALQKATFKVTGTDKNDGEEGTFGVVDNTLTIGIVNFDNVAGSTNLALQFYADANEDNTNGWRDQGDTTNPTRPLYRDFNTVAANTRFGTSDGRKYTTVTFELQFDREKLAMQQSLKLGQKYLGDLIITMGVDNIAGGVTSFDIIVHVYVTGSAKFFYLDGVAGKDGNSGMFPNEAKKTLNGVITSNGYTINDPIFLVNTIQPKANGTLTWDASKFLNAVTVEDENQYTEEALRQLSQVKVYRYPGNHPRKDGETGNIVDQNNNILFYNGIFTGQMINVPEGTTFSMNNVCLDGGSQLDNNTDYNPMGTTMHSDYPLISIAEGATVSISNSSLVNNKNTHATNLAGAIYNGGTLSVDGVSIKDNVSSGKGTGVYQAGTMNLGNTQTITVADQIYLADEKILEAPHGALYADDKSVSKLSDITVYAKAYPVDTSYSGRVIVHYTGYEPTAPQAPFWKTLVNGQVPQSQSSILKSRKEAESSYESDKYILNSTELGIFEKANGGDENAKSYFTSTMVETYEPSNLDIVMYTTQANLPVELLYFTAECMGEATQLQWATASETNNEYFTVERSSDAVNYEEVARVQGAGTSSQRNDYSLMVDNNANGITYYRLRQTDIDGKYEIFAPIAIQCKDVKEATTISIYPVPAKDQVTVLSNNSPMTRVEIYSIMGNKVSEEQVEGHQATLQIGHLATGVYAAKIHTEDGQVINVRLIKK